LLNGGGALQILPVPNEGAVSPSVGRHHRLDPLLLPHALLIVVTLFHELPLVPCSY
jgi:hypothetical protein